MSWQSTLASPHPTRDPAQLYEQALAAHQEGRLDDAETLYRTVLRYDRRHADALRNLSLLNVTRGHFIEALKYARKGLYESPNSLEFLNLLGLALKGLNKYAEAMRHYEKALTINPEASGVRANYGALLQHLNRHDEALANFQRARELAPDVAVAHSNVGVALRTLGRLDEAREAFERAIALEPDSPIYYRLLGMSQRFEADGPHMLAMEEMAAELDAFSEPEQADLHYALGKAYADLGQHERGFRHVLAGSALVRKRLPYDEAEVLALLEQSKIVFNAEVMRERSGMGDPSDQPIFIVGLPRSGSTLIEQILASHPDVYGAGELRDFVTAVEGLDRGPGRTPEEVDGNELRELGVRYLGHLRARVPVPAKRITDKMLGNSRLVGLIHLALPNAKIIHARRNLVDTCLSCFSLMFGTGHHYSYELGELGRFARAHDGVMEHWREVMPPGVMLEVQYEDVVADLETHARRIIAHCGLEWTDACLEFYKTERPVQTASVVQVRQPIYRSSVDRWKPYQSMLQPLFEALDFHPPAD